MDVNGLLTYLDEELEAVQLEGTKSLPDYGGLDDPSRLGQTSTYFGLGGFDKSAFNASKGLWKNTLSSYRDTLSRLANEWFDSITTDTSLKGLSSSLSGRLGRFEKEMLSHYTKAYQAGGMKMGNPYFRDVANLSPADLKFLKQAVRQEMGYLKNFLGGDAKKKIAGGHFRGMKRVDGFVNSLDSQFFNGQVAAAGDNHVFLWELGGGVALHCEDCFSLNFNNPYTKATLPTVPRAGGTKCMSWCQCTLRVEGIHGGAFPGTGLPMDAECGVWDAEGVPVSGSIQKLFDNIYKSMNIARGKIIVTQGETQKMWVARRAALNKNVIDLAQQYDVKIKPRWSVGDIRANLSTLSKKGLSHIDNLNKLASGMEIYLVSGGSMQFGQVELRDGVLGFNILGRWIKVESADDFLIFAKE